MVKLTIDGKSVSVETGMTVLEAARSADIDIPTLCHHEMLEPYGLHFIGPTTPGLEAFLSKVPLEGVDDLQGLKMRAPEGMVQRVFAAAEPFRPVPFRIADVGVDESGAEHGGMYVCAPFIEIPLQTFGERQNGMFADPIGAAARQQAGQVQGGGRLAPSAGAPQPDAAARPGESRQRAGAASLRLPASGQCPARRRLIKAGRWPEG